MQERLIKELGRIKDDIDFFEVNDLTCEAIEPDVALRQDPSRGVSNK